MINLKNVDLLAIDCKQPNKAIKSLNISKRNINFGKVMLLTDDSFLLEEQINNIDITYIPKIKNIQDYNNLCLRLTNYSNNDFILLIQHDSFITNSNNWDDIFFNYDYIGAPWKESDIKNWGLVNRVGNGGFSLRSKKLLNCLLNYETTQGWNEDGFITNFKINDMLQQGIKFPNVDIAQKFAIEHQIENKVYNPSDHFGFHGQGNYDIALDYINKNK